MKVLVLGGDGRAHTLVWKLFNSPLVTELVCAPGNGGTSQITPSVALDQANAATIAHWAFDEGIDLIVPAGGESLRAGLVDEVIALQVSVCGPSQRSTALETSRCQAKEFMLRYNLQTAPGRAFTSLATAERYLAAQPLPVMIKADHPSGGEATYHDRYAALEGLRELFAARPVDGANDGVVIESYLPGPRVVMSAFADGNTTIPLLPTRLYDRIEEGNSGTFAHGVGAHTGTGTFARRLGAYLHEKLIAPVAAGLVSENLPFWGILNIDCIVTDQGPRLTAVRSSMREGEAQVVLPRLQDDLLPWLQAMITRRLHDMPAPTWAITPSVGLGLMARGYPYHFPVGGPLRGVDELEEGVLAFHSATENPAGIRYTPQRSRGSGAGLLGLLGGSGLGTALRTSGGLVLTVVGMGATLASARGRALINADRVAFEGRTFRGDIGAKEFG